MDFLYKIKNYDKYLHLIIGTFVTILFGLLHPVLGVAATLAIARWKELQDREDPSKHTYDGWDAFATAVGILPGQAVLTLLTHYGYWVSKIVW